MNHEHDMKRVGILYEYNYDDGDNAPSSVSWWHEKCDCGYERYYSRSHDGAAKPEKKDRYVEIKPKPDHS